MAKCKCVRYRLLLIFLTAATIAAPRTTAELIFVRPIGHLPPPPRPASQLGPSFSSLPPPPPQSPEGDFAPVPVVPSEAQVQQMAQYTNHKPAVSAQSAVPLTEQDDENNNGLPPPLPPNIIFVRPIGQESGIVNHKAAAGPTFEVHKPGGEMDSADLEIVRAIEKLTASSTISSKEEPLLISESIANFDQLPSKMYSWSEVKQVGAGTAAGAKGQFAAEGHEDLKGAAWSDYYQAAGPLSGSGSSGPMADDFFSIYDGITGASPAPELVYVMPIDSHGGHGSDFFSDPSTGPVTDGVDYDDMMDSMKNFASDMKDTLLTLPVNFGNAMVSYWQSHKERMQAFGDMQQQFDDSKKPPIVHYGKPIVIKKMNLPSTGTGASTSTTGSQQQQHIHQYYQLLLQEMAKSNNNSKNKIKIKNNNNVHTLVGFKSNSNSIHKRI